MRKSEFAPAKINLTLEVRGRRADGYHELRSLVVFARDVGDVVTLSSGDAAHLQTSGPFANDIAGINLVDKAAALFVEKNRSAAASSLSLIKHLPVASGIGGGSADAAAALRVLSSRYPGISEDELAKMARALGADVPVCMRARPVIMTGIGETLNEVALPHDLHAVLVNPLVDVPANKTAQVFAALGAPMLLRLPTAESAPRFQNVHDVVEYARSRGNDLEMPARAVLPTIDAVLSELRRTEDALLVHLSGAGPTCFALFETQSSAEAGALALRQRQPGWWIEPTRLA